MGEYGPPKVRAGLGTNVLLTATSGGIRSIVQLTILKELEGLIGLDIPIQEFFDLIIGTRYVTYSELFIHHTFFLPSFTLREPC